MKEHYGIEVAACMIRKITENHAQKMGKWNPTPARENAKLLVAEMDGGMVPIVEVEKRVEGIDLRKTRKVYWKEAKLCFARGHQKIDRIYGAVIGTAEEAGTKLYECAKRAGLTSTTYVHALGDGAPWIVEEIENQFGRQAHFLVDFYHMSEYLAGASIWCNVLDPREWLEEKKAMMKEGKVKKVFSELKMKLEGVEKEEEENGLVKCVRYMEKRIRYMNYAEAQEKELPIGSGEIESSHRHIVQKRLKIAGAWWKTENANAMLQLRTGRANKYWVGYWREQKAA